MKAKKKLLELYKKFQEDKDVSNVQAAPDEKDILKWHCVIVGPEGTIWENGIFKLDLQFNEDYPKAPPSAKFNPPIYHPNVYKDGRLCLDILTPKEWSPSNTMLSILLSIQSLLNDPNPDSPANHDATRQYKDYIEKKNDDYVKEVRKCVEHSWTTFQ